MAGTRVGDLFMGLALHPDMAGFNAGNAALATTVARIKSMATAAAAAKLDAQKLGEQMGLLEKKAPPSHWARIKASGDGVTSTFWRMAAAAAAFFSVAKVGGMVKETVELGSHLNDTAQKTGLSTDALQKWSYAAKLNGADAEVVEGSVVKLSKGLEVMAKTGEGPVVDGLRALHISLNEPAVKARDLNGILYLVANAMSKMPDGAKKTAAAMDLFGRSGAQMIPTLNNGVQGIAGTSAELAKLGGLLAGEDIAKLDDLGDNIDRTKVAAQGLKDQAVIALLPLLDRMMARFQEWIANNQELIKSTLQNVIEGLADALSTLGSILAFVVQHWKLFGSIIVGATIVGGIMKLIRLIMFLETAMTSAAIQGAIAWAAILGPILLIGAAIVALGILIYKYRDEIGDALHAIGDFFSEVGTSIKNAFWSDIDAITGMASKAWAAIKSGFKAAFDWVIDLPVVKQLVSLINDVRGLLSQDKVTSEQIAQAESTGGEFGMFGPGGAYDPNNRVGATGPAGRVGTDSGPARPTGASGGVSVQNTYSFQIDAKNADAAQVVQLMDDKLREHDERNRRETAAALGVVSQ